MESSPEIGLSLLEGDNNIWNSQELWKKRGVVRQAHLMCDWCRAGSWGGQLESRTAENSGTIAKVPGASPGSLDLTLQVTWEQESYVGKRHK